MFTLCKMLKNSITPFVNLKRKIKHVSSVKVIVPLDDLCLDLILSCDLKLYNLSIQSQRKFKVATFFIIKFNVENIKVYLQLIQ